MTTSTTPEEQKDQTNFWGSMWEKEAVGESLPRFDTGTPSPYLVKAINEGIIPVGHALVPGCGSGYDVTALASTPGREAVGLDLAPAGIQRARIRLESLGDPSLASACSFEQGDFFTYQPSEPFTFIYDYTFLCALPLELREAWAKQMKALLKPRGEGMLMTLIFPICDKEGGPPYKVSLESVKSLLEAEGFICQKLELLPPELCHKGRDGSGNWNAASGIGHWTLP